MNSAYSKIRPLIASGFITDIAGIAKEVGIYTLQKDLGIGNVALNRRFRDPEAWTVGQLRQLAILVDMPFLELLQLIDHQLGQPKKKQRK